MEFHRNPRRAYRLWSNNCTAYVVAFLEMAHEVSHGDRCIHGYGSKNYRHPPKDYGARSSLLFTLPTEPEPAEEVGFQRDGDGQRDGWIQPQQHHGLRDVFEGPAAGRES